MTNRYAAARRVAYARSQRSGLPAPRCGRRRRVDGNAGNAVGEMAKNAGGTRAIGGVGAVHD